MKRFCIIGALIFSAALCASAADVAYRIGREAGPFILQYLIPTESTNLLYCTFKVPDDAELPLKLNLSPKAAVLTEDYNYALVNSFNFCVKDEGTMEYAYFTQPGQELNFVLEFEKYPLDEPFTLVADKMNPDSYRFSGVVVDTTSVATVDSGWFLNVTPYTRYGEFFREGNPSAYYNGEDYMLNVTACDVKEDYNTSYRSALITVTNNSDHPYDFKVSGISAVGFKPAGKKIKEVKLPLLSSDECNRVWFAIDKSSVKEMLGETVGEEIGGSITRIALNTNLPGLGGLGMLALGALVSNCDKTDLTPYMKELNEVREQTMKDYATDKVINPGETYSCFVSFKLDSKQTSMTVSVVLEGQTYKFNW